ncbi:SGNH/GDSL hydrolase family protein [Bhargavaea ginsengi]|uniref:SGNH/GDSL hydrolase family protein n=1 Tax=Bhargavaea ginsengi TaxID=426757 RepID=UPI00203D8DEC|nr:SGNH/GDSL hydrolase family protein [Bhargavaea ginsengi]MCM3088752.1 SGNH/GDSL hydrolase family protein [Bhargavaea ginsengi]
MKKRICILAAALFLTGCLPGSDPVSFGAMEDRGFGQYEVPPTFAPRTVVLVGLGDSLTQGVGDDRKREGYVGRLAVKMEEWKGVKGVVVHNLAKRGRRSDQLAEQLSDPRVRQTIAEADILTLTIGGNDLMKVVKEDLFNLDAKAFEGKLEPFMDRLSTSLFQVRRANPDAVLIVLGLYNPLTIVTDEESEFDGILSDWNAVLEDAAVADGRACYVPVDDLFITNRDLVYHTDFFHPNGKGYSRMTDRIMDALSRCGLNRLSGGELEF